MKEDQGATVLTPLTTVVHALMEDGATKEEPFRQPPIRLDFQLKLILQILIPFSGRIGEEDAKRFCRRVH